MKEARTRMQTGRTSAGRTWVSVAVCLALLLALVALLCDWTRDGKFVPTDIGFGSTAADEGEPTTRERGGLVAREDTSARIPALPVSSPPDVLTELAIQIVDASDGRKLPRFPLRIRSAERTFDVVANGEGVIFRSQLPSWAWPEKDIVPEWSCVTKLPRKYLAGAESLRTDMGLDGVLTVHVDLGASLLVQFATPVPAEMICDLYTGAYSDPIDCLRLGRCFKLHEEQRGREGTHLYFPPVDHLRMREEWSLRVSSLAGVAVAEAPVPSGARELEVLLTFADAAAIDLELTPVASGRRDEGAVDLVSEEGLLARLSLDELPVRFCGLSKHSSVVFQLDAPVLTGWEETVPVEPGTTRRVSVSLASEVPLRHLGVQLRGNCGDGNEVTLILRSVEDPNLLLYTDGTCSQRVEFKDVPAGAYHLSVSDDDLREWQPNSVLVEVPSLDVELTCVGGESTTFRVDVPREVVAACEGGGYWLVMDSAGNRVDEGVLNAGTKPTFAATETSTFTWYVWACSGTMAWGDERDAVSDGGDGRRIALAASDFRERVFVWVFSGAEVPVEGVEVLVNGRGVGRTSAEGVLVVDAKRAASFDVASSDWRVIGRYGLARGEPGREASFEVAKKR